MSKFSGELAMKGAKAKAAKASHKPPFKPPLQETQATLKQLEEKRKEEKREEKKKKDDKGGELGLGFEEVKIEGNLAKTLIVPILQVAECLIF